MSFSTHKRALSWVENELKAMTKAPRNSIVPISMSPVFKISARQQDYSPTTWIDLKSNASSSEAASIYTIDSRKKHVQDLVDSESLYTPSLHWEVIEETNEKQIVTPSFSQRPGAMSSGSQTATTLESDIVYPTTLRVLFVFISLAISIFVVGLDRTIVATAAPRITDDFHSLSDVGWYNSAYLIAVTALAPSWGKVYQIFAVKSVFILNILLFMGGSAVCGFSSSSTVFIIGRAIAGIGSGGVFTGSITIISFTVPLHKRPRFVGSLTALFWIASFVGPIVGGIFTDKVTWRWCFYINLPLGAVSIIGVVLLLQNPAHLATEKSFRERLRELDFIGPVLFIPANVGLIFALQLGGSEYLWNSPIVLGLFSIFGILAPLWVISQVYLKEKATIPMRILTQRTVFFSSLYAFFSGAAFIILVFYLPLYFQAVRDTSATGSAIEILPLVITTTISAIAIGILLSMVGYVAPFMIFGAALVAVGAGLLSTFGVDTVLGLWLGYQILVGVGSGMTAQVIEHFERSNDQTPIIAVQATVQPQDIPVAVSTALFFQILGQAIFVAIAQAVFLNELLPQIQAVNTNLAATDILRAGATGLKTLVTESQLPAVLVDYANSLDIVFKVGAAAATVAVILALFVEWKTIKKDEKAKDVEAPGK